MPKLPEDQRPPFAIIEAKLKERLSNKLARIFVQDIQNDCACDIEIYECDYDCILHTSLGGVKELSFGRCTLPMQKDLTDKEIWILLEEACKKASLSPSFDLWNTMFYNVDSDIDKVLAIWQKTTSMDISANRGSEIVGWVAADFVPIDCVYFLPEPEFFGVISVNIGGFGVLCFPKNILRKSL